MNRLHRLLLFFLVFLHSSYLVAQEEKQDSIGTELKRVMTRVTDGLVTGVRYTEDKIKEVGKQINAIDTNYISPNLYNLAFMLEHSTWYEHYQLGTNQNNQIQKLNFSPNLGTKMGIYFGWRWIFLGYTFDVEDLFGDNKNKPKKKEMSLNIYSSKFGMDLYYRKTGSDFKLRSQEGFNLDEQFKNIQFDGLQSNIMGLNAYWIFNHKRFSYPAAYSQSTNQRKSAGSFMAGFSYSRHKIHFDHNKLPEPMKENLNPYLQFNKIKYSDYSFGFGYGYNWVFAKNWVSNLSLLPGIGFKKSKIDDNDFKDEHWIKDINFNLITRAAVVYNSSKYFAGASLVMHTYDYRKPNLSVTNSFGTLRIYAGFNFWKRKPKTH
ncbi:MAG: DUF4421 domain-containing protein [Bacteroidaceae bacterium]|nr:DUF4421 domain-containing protein [Bacteroidaceae bacterium]